MSVFWRTAIAAVVALCAPPLGVAAASAATVTVSTRTDALVAHGGRCSLRQAIEALDALAQRSQCGPLSARSDTIVLGRGRYTLTLLPRGGDDNASGDLDVTSRAAVTIIGAGAGATVIDARALGDRVMSVAQGARLTLKGLTITGGRTPSDNSGCPDGGGGGGILNAGELTLAAVVVAGNTAGGGTVAGGGCGGGLYNQGTVAVTDSAIYDNRADGEGGGIFSTAGGLTLTNSTLSGNFAPAGGGIAVLEGPSALRNATVADNGALAPGGSGGGLFVRSSTAADDMSVQGTVVASNQGANCAGDAGAIVDRGPDLSYGDRTCPGGGGDPRLGVLKDNGGPTPTMAIAAGSAAIDRIPARTGRCPPTDQRGVRRPRGTACDIGAYESATPTISLSAPFAEAFYLRGSRILARFRCGEGGVPSAIAICSGSVASGRPISTGHSGTAWFTVTAIDKSGNRTTTAIRYEVFDYVNPLRDVSGLTRRRIDLGVDYAGSGPLLAIGRGRVTFASNTDSGPPSCWAISCWPGGGIVVYRLLDGPFAGRYVYVAEHISVVVRTGQILRPGQKIATLHVGYPWSEWGWAAGPGPEALAMTDGHRCPCSDPGGWSTIDGRDMNRLLVALGAPSGYAQANTPVQRMPRGWPTWPR